jgi:pantetheine-phosphate adenylyltransferase
MVEYANSQGATCILRGIRAISDYEYELQMALMNRKLEPTLETVFMMPADKYSYISSRLVREVAQAGGPVKGLVPEVVEQKLREKIVLPKREPRYVDVSDRTGFAAKKLDPKGSKRKKKA